MLTWSQDEGLEHQVEASTLVLSMDQWHHLAPRIIVTDGLCHLRISQDYHPTQLPPKKYSDTHKKITLFQSTVVSPINIRYKQTLLLSKEEPKQMTKRFSSRTISHQDKFLPMEGSLKHKRDPYEHNIKFKITILFNPIERTLICIKGYFIQ